MKETLSRYNQENTKCTLNSTCTLRVLAHVSIIVPSPHLLQALAEWQVQSHDLAVEWQAGAIIVHPDAI